MRIGETLRKAAGLLVELPPEEETAYTRSVADPTEGVGTAMPASSASRAGMSANVKTVDQIVRDSPGPNLDEIHAPVTPSQPAVTSDGQVNFSAVYELATLPKASFSAEQVLEVLHQLPAELPMEAKRATLKVTFNAMGQSLSVSPETVVADASRKVAALASYAKGYAGQADEYVAKAEEEIKTLEAQIEQRKQGIEKAKQMQTHVVECCTAESDRLDDVLEFFSLDVAPSKHA